LSTARRLRELFARPGAIHVALVYDAITAMIAESVGFEVAFMSGSGVAETFLAMPDGSLTLTEAVLVAHNMSNAVRIPILADGDTGYGNSLSAARAVREFELNGVAGVMIEDQGSLPRGSAGGATVIPTAQFVGKIKAAVRARRDADTVIIARTDAYESKGFDECVSRMNACVAAGADVAFIQGRLSESERGAAPGAIRAPCMAPGSFKHVEAAGYKIVLSAGVAPVAMKAVKEFLSEIMKRGNANDLSDRMLSWQEVDSYVRQRALIREAVEDYNEPASLTRI
jgi:2-methylisocitrate lyase-like PEP mutase family enzyme